MTSNPSTSSAPYSWNCVECTTANAEDARNCVKCTNPKLVVSDLKKPTACPLKLVTKMPDDEYESINGIQPHLVHLALELKELAEYLRANATRGKYQHYDISFPPINKSIMGIGTDADHPSVRDVDHWSNPEEITTSNDESGLEWSIFNHPSPHDAVQGKLGDCWLITALSMVAIHPLLLSRIFVTKKYNPEGIYALLLCKEGEWVKVIVDSRFPCHRNNKPVYAHSRRKQLWVMLLEKAMAKLLGSYMDLSHGYASLGFQMLTGYATDRIFLDVYGPKTIAGMVKSNIARGDVIVCSTSGRRSAEELNHVGLVTGHVYTLLDAQEVAGTWLFSVRNVWDAVIWKGKWSPNSPAWNDVPVDQRPAGGTGYPATGTFWISVEDFKKYFYGFDTCRIQFHTCFYNPILTMPKPTDARYQVVRVKATKNTTLDIAVCQQRAREKHIGDGLAMLIVTDEDNNIIQCTNCGNINQCRLLIMLTPGTYYFTLFSTFNFAQRKEVRARLICYAEQRLVVTEGSVPVCKLSHLLLKLATAKGKKTEYAQGDKKMSVYVMSNPDWYGWVIAAVNEHKHKYFHVTADVNFPNTRDVTRTTRNTLDVVKPLHSMLINVITARKDPNIQFVPVEIQMGHSDKGIPSRQENQGNYPPLTLATFPLHSLVANKEFFDSTVI